MRICTVIVDERPIRVLATDTFKKDRLVCFLHGWGDSADTFAPLLALAEWAGFGAVAFDWPGFGSSPRPENAWGAQEYADFLGKFLEKYAKGSQEIILIAHSMGARFALRFAVEHPERVSKLVFTGAAGIPPERDPKRDLVAKIAKKIFSLPVLSLFYERVRDRFSSADYRSSGAMRDIFREIISLDQRPEYPRVKCPVLLLWGESDDQTPLADYEYMMGHIPDVRGRVFDGGHFFFAQQPSAFWREAENFIGNNPSQ